MEASSPPPGVVPRTNPVPPPRPIGIPATAQLAYARRLAFLVDVVSARMLALLALLGGVGVFGYACYDPSNLRNWTAALYAVGVLWPMGMLYWKTDKQPKPD